MSFTFNQFKNKIQENIRNQIRFKRNTLTENKQQHSSEKITKHIINDHRIKKAKYIGLFINFEGEIKTNLLIKTLLDAGKKIYLPIIHPLKNSKKLLFSQYTLSTHLTSNKFKIYQPKFEKKLSITPQELDILFIPLVAFDKHGHRIGMGGGFYDYTLKHIIKQHTQNTLIGLAHDCQYTIKNIPRKKWDIPLQEIITPSTHWVWKNTNLTQQLKY